MTNVITGTKITGTQTSTEDNLAGQCDAHATHPFKMALRTPGLAVAPSIKQEGFTERLSQEYPISAKSDDQNAMGIQLLTLI